ncbi:MAG: hypothetical protein L6R37_006245 [Teloschistes peruensis]|nr:MAG: hypothetical protein L6R37_006245 [Teloschistes peruensis]
MIRRKPKSPPSTYLTPPPEDLPSHTAAVISDWDADDEGAMSAEDRNASPPTSLDEQPNGPYFPSRPTLSDVLSNTSPPPWTLSAFTAYLSQNHCLENLEFTMDAERYRDRYRTVAGQMNGKAMNVELKECNYIRMLWKRLMDAYIVQDGPREINIPSDVRESLLSLPNHTAPPPPDELDAAAKIIYDLMEESVLVGFLNEAPVSTSIESASANGNYFLENTRQSSSRIRRAVSSRERKPTRSRSRRRASPSSSSLEVQGSPSDRQATTSTLISTKTKRSRAQSHLSSDSGEASLTNDSTSASSPGHEPMTPPNTPPSSDIGGSSPRNRGDHTWKKMLVWKKKSSQGMRDSRFPTLED